MREEKCVADSITTQVQIIMEKDINLAIVLQLKELLDKNDRNIGVYYTRTEDTNPTFEQRAQLGG